MFACVYIPDFSVEAIVRAQPLLRERAVAVLEGKPPLTRVVAVNEKARQLGMEAGMTKLQAEIFTENSCRKDIPQSSTTNKDSALRRSSSPVGAVLRQRFPEQENTTHAALLDVAHAFSPRVEDAAADTLLLDLAGLERLYGAPAKMGSDLKSRVSAVGIEANVAIAANPDAALHAARGLDGITVITAGSEAQRLGILPIQILLDAFGISSPATGTSKAREHDLLREQMLDTLERWGVRNFHTLALLPEHALTSRLGHAGAQLRRLARGEGMRMLSLCEPSSHFEELMELESPVEAIESLAFLLNRLLEQLCARLEARTLAVQELHLRLQLEPRVADEQSTTIQELNRPFAESHNVIDKPQFERVLRLPVPMRDSKVFLKLLQLDLVVHPPGAPVVKLWITAQTAPPRYAQRGLFLPVSPEAEKLEITLARIHGIVGERRAGIARLLDSHRRDVISMEHFRAEADAASAPLAPTLSDSNNSLLAMRLIRPACQLIVEVLEGRPASLAATHSKNGGALLGKVLWSAGPWRSSGDWWTETTSGEPSGPWDREEWDIALATPQSSAKIRRDGLGLYRIYRDVGTGQWFADASYD